MSVFKRGNVWWYEFWFAGRWIHESTKAKSKTVAKLAEQKRRRELEEGFTSIEDGREERIPTITEITKEYLDGYRLRNRSATFAEYAIGHLTRPLSATMIVDADEVMVPGNQEQRLREKAAPKIIDEEVGFLLRLLGERGELNRAHPRKQKTLKLKCSKPVAKAYSPWEKRKLVEASTRGALAHHLPGPRACAECGAEGRDPALALEPSRSEKAISHRRQKQDRSRGRSHHPAECCAP